MKTILDTSTRTHIAQFASFCPELYGSFSEAISVTGADIVVPDGLESEYQGLKITDSATGSQHVLSGGTIANNSGTTALAFGKHFESTTMFEGGIPYRTVDTNLSDNFTGDHLVVLTASDQGADIILSDDPKDMAKFQRIEQTNLPVRSIFDLLIAILHNSSLESHILSCAHRQIRNDSRAHKRGRTSRFATKFWWDKTPELTTQECIFCKGDIKSYAQTLGWKY